MPEFFRQCPNLPWERGLQPASTSQLQATLKRHKCRAPQIKAPPVFSRNARLVKPRCQQFQKAPVAFFPLLPIFSRLQARRNLPIAAKFPQQISGIRPVAVVLGLL
jgi:hypothetical protein